MNSFTLPAYAKVNLHLDVLGKFPDGFHQLLTLFERIDLSDELTVDASAGPGIEMECDDRKLPCDSSNLVVRAAEEYRRISGWEQGLRVRLKKRIPVGGGLGGGSSNASAMLAAMQQLSGNRLTESQLMACARKLGADVAFFAARTSWAVGRVRGDEIEPIPLETRFRHLLVTPDFPIPTKEVYQAFRLNAPAREINPLLAALKRGKLSSVRDLLYNALEPAVESLYPAIRNVKSEMETAGLEKPMVSGSGSAVFALCDSKDQADSAAEILRKNHPAWRVFTAMTA